MSRTIKWLALFLILNLVPIATFGSPEDAPKVKPVDLTLADLNEMKISIKQEGNRPILKFFGNVQTNCWKKFRVTQIKPNQKSPLASGQFIGYWIQDLDNGRECVKTNPATEDSCASPDSCVQLSKQDDLHFDFTEADADAEIALMKPEFADPPTVATEIILGSSGKKIRTPAEIRRAIEQQEHAAFVNRVKKLKNIVANCNRTMDELVMAQEALSELIQLQVIAEAEVEAYEKRFIDKSFLVIEASINKAKVDALPSIEEQLASLASDSDQGDKVAKLYWLISEKYKAAGQHAKAIEVVRTAKDVPGISHDQKFKLDNWEMDTKVAWLNASAQRGLQMNPNAAEFTQFYNGMVYELQARAQNHLNACNEEIASLDHSKPIDPMAMQSLTPSCFALNKTQAQLRQVGEAQVTAQQADERIVRQRQQAYESINQALNGNQKQGAAGSNPMSINNPTTMTSPMGGMSNFNSFSQTNPLQGNTGYWGRGFYGSFSM